jgi:uncharacterized repeat protein (TIGR03803 family)
MPQTRRPFRILILGLVLSTALAASSKGAQRPHPLLTSPHIASATETVLYSFQGGSDGALSYAPLIADSQGALYGTTIHGGIPSGGYGTVFKLTPSGSGYSESVLYAFQGGYDGAYPFAGVIADKHGALYGTTYTGGPSGAGSVYKLTRSHSAYSKTILYGFSGGSDGATPQGTLYMDRAGNLFGTTTNGGTAGTGVVYELSPGASSYTFRVIHSFQGGNDAANPQYGALVADASGALYGTTSIGGSPQSWGAVYKLTPSGSTYQESIICAFPYPNGSHPFGGLTIDVRGTLYGTTTQGGPSNTGTVFKLTPSGSGYLQTVLYAFQAASLYDGAAPQADILIDRATGSLYGTTQYGGTAGVGTVFKLTPFASPTSIGHPGNDAGSGYLETVLHSFQGGTDGKNPEAGFIQLNGVLYSTTFFGGGPGNGTVFSITP